MQTNSSGSRTGKVQTVLGLIDPQDLGVAHPHEHILSDFSQPLPPDAPASAVSRYTDDIRLDNIYEIRRMGGNLSNSRLDSIDDAIASLHLFRQWGGGSMFESTTTGLRPDPDGLARISRATGVHIVKGTGFYQRKYLSAAEDALSAEQMEAVMRRDLLEGSGVSAVRAGFIGEIGMGWPHHPTEERALRAAARVAHETGVALQIHPGRDQQGPLTALRTALEEGVAADKVIMSHIDARLFTPSEMTELATAGCYLEFDLFGHESSFNRLRDWDMYNDGVRVQHLRRLADEGFGERLLIAQDICVKVHTIHYGGEGYHHLLKHIVPLMRRRGFSPEEITTIMVDNPARVVTVR